MLASRGAPFIRSETDNLFIGVQGDGQAHRDLSQCFELHGSLKLTLRF